jgi:lipopolysaccharide/colanic/teichoic acid biosynthesis glycosyltransferase
MRIVERGYRAVYDHSTYATELERTSTAQEYRRRLRIGAGNMQQALRLFRLADPRRGWLAFLFLSGKGLRPMVPFLAILAVAASVLGAAEGVRLFDVILALELMLIATVLFATNNPAAAMPRPLAWLRYLSEGHLFSFLGAVGHLMQREQIAWGPSRLSAPEDISDSSFVPFIVRASKRMLDILLALGALLIMAIVFVPIALAIKLDTPGPILYRQTRVGRSTALTTNLFSLLKFRTMGVNAEHATGPVWASRGDPRVSRVGRFLRKTRLDELPQCINVLRGEMSVIGPRPERPHFVRKFDDAIPFYTDRTFDLRPGITGLAQVNQHYDTSIEDVRTKMIYDHAYAVRLSNWWSWLTTDIAIISKTVFTMMWAKGQ